MLDLPIGTPDWLSCAQRQLEEELSVERRAQEAREQQLETSGETLQLLVDSIKTILSNHNRQLADVKHLLRAMAKVNPVPQLLHKHTGFLNTLAKRCVICFSLFVLGICRKSTKKYL